MSQPAVSVIVTVLNERSTIAALVTALKHQTYVPQEVVVVDGGSNDGTTEWLHEVAQSGNRRHNSNRLPFKLRVVEHRGNRSRGRNRAIEMAANQVIAVTDAGCVPSSNWLQALVAEGAQLIERKQLSWSQSLVVGGYYRARVTNAFEAAVAPYVLVMPDVFDAANFLPATRSMLITRAAWEQVGGFDERLSDNEDYEFAHRLRSVGVAMVATKRAIVTWSPRRSLAEFMWMTFRFSRGDARARLRPRSFISIWLRALIFVSITIWAHLSPSPWIWFIPGALLCLYLGWTLFKNYRYARQGWWWLPILQLTSDISILMGSVVGWLTPLEQKKAPAAN